MIDLINLSLQFTGEYLFRDVNLKIHATDKIALVGANGSGKTSLLRLITGEYEPESGTIQKQKKISIGYLPQEQIFTDDDALLPFVENAVSGIQELRSLESEIISLLEDDELDIETRDDLVFQLGTVHNRLEDLDSFTLQSRCERILLGLGFRENDFFRGVDEFSGGWQMRIALAKLLIASPDVLLLDEPTNHLDIDSLRWLISYLRSFHGALILVSHDRHFVNQVTAKTMEIFLRKVSVFRGNYDAYLKFKVERDEQLELTAAQQQKKIDETKRFIERFRYKATKAKQVQSRIKQLEKMELIELPDAESSIHFHFVEAPPSGRTVMTLNNISHSYGAAPVFSGINLMIERGERIAFVGPNGAGKTTLAKIIAGVLHPTSGRAILGHNTEIGYYEQEVTGTLDPELDIYETLQMLAEEKSIAQIRSLAGAFLFTGDAVFKKIGVLSGGEKSRVALLRLLLQKANLLVLDEPTNHLDFNSKKILQQALLQFTGTIIIVSHDVDFLEPIAKKVIEFRDGEMKTYYGDILYYLEKKENEAADSSNRAEPPKESTALSRKDIKRLEAEQRQKRHNSTKDVKTQIAELEKNIETMEKKIAQLEVVLTDPDIYRDAVTAKETTQDYKDSKGRLQQLLAQWEQCSLQLAEIEKQFDEKSE